MNTTKVLVASVRGTNVVTNIDNKPKNHYFPNNTNKNHEFFPQTMQPTTAEFLQIGLLALDFIVEKNQNRVFVNRRERVKK